MYKRQYKINIQALSSDPKYADSLLSNSVSVTTSVAATNGIEMLTAHESVIDSGKLTSGGAMNDPQVTALVKFYEKENQSDFYAGQLLIPLKATKITEDYIDVDWSAFEKMKHEYVDEYRVQWHCLNTNDRGEHKCAGNVFSYRIRKLRSGYTYAIKVCAHKYPNQMVHQSKNHIFQLNASPDCPILKLRACNFKYITMEWNRPKTYGDTQVVAYKVHVNGKVEAILSAEQQAFTLSKGEPCHEYKFQVQAVASDDTYSSPLSPTLTVVWPGIMAPNLRQLENEDDGMIRVMWDEPVITGNAKISYFRVVTENEHTGQEIAHGPLESHLRECDIHGLDYGKYKIYLEIAAYGLSEPFRSKPLHVELGGRPEAPQLLVKVVGLEQRTKLDRIAASLVNKRDRLLKIVTNSSQSKPTKEVNSTLLAKSMSTLRQLDETLNDCLRLLSSYTGYFVASLSWTCHQPNPLVKIIGYKVFVNGKQYGSDLPESIRSVRVKLSLERAVHNVYVAVYTTRNRKECQTSNCVELLSESFFPFTFYCLHGIHVKNMSWPDKGCCAYQDSLPVERTQLTRTREPLNTGLLAEPEQALKCEVVDLHGNKMRNLIDAKTKSGKFTVILFWTKWCLSSIRTLNHFVMFGKRYTNLCEYTACHVGKENVFDLLELLKKAGYTDNNEIRFVNDMDYAGKAEPDIVSSVEPFKIKGVPSICIVNKSAQIVWRGRYCSWDFASFEAFLSHALSECMEQRCSVRNCDCCRAEISIDKEISELRHEQKHLNQYVELIGRPHYDVDVDSCAKVTAQQRLPRISPKQLISIKTKPYSPMRGGGGAESERSSVTRSSFGSSRSATTRHQSQRVGGSGKSRSGSSAMDPLGRCYFRSSSRSHRKH